MPRYRRRKPLFALAVGWRDPSDLMLTGRYKSFKRKLCAEIARLSILPEIAGGLMDRTHPIALNDDANG